MHSILSAQLKSLKLSDSARQTIVPLCHILDSITRAGEEEEDQLTSTIEALRIMQSTISQFGAATAIPSGENSGSSSEYTTPAQSQATSPSHEQSPPPVGASMQEARATVSSAAKLMQNLTTSGEGQVTASTHQGSISPTSTSPTHGERVSTLATHSHSAHPVTKSHTMQDRSGTTHLPVDVGGAARRKSDTELQRHRIRPSSQQLPVSSSESSRQMQTRSIDFSVA